MTPAERVRTVLKKLRPLYGHEPIGLDYQTPFQLVVGVILSAQCTDKRVNAVTATFFDRLKEPQDYLSLPPDTLENLIRSTGFFRNKAKNILGAAETILREYGGRVPKTMVELVKIPGFGRKTANVILTQLHQINEGVCVDTHVLRLSKRLGLSHHEDPIRVERDLMVLTPKKNWHEIPHFLILHGRRVCFARSPACKNCVLRPLCPYANLSPL
jgi:endonuclease-3